MLVSVGSLGFVVESFLKSLTFGMFRALCSVLSVGTMPDGRIGSFPKLQEKK